MKKKKLFKAEFQIREEFAEDLVNEGNYESSLVREKMTGNGLDYGFENEEIIELEIKESDNER